MRAIVDRSAVGGVFVALVRVEECPVEARRESAELFFVLRFDRKARKIALPDSLRLGSDGFKILIRYLTLKIELRLLKAYV